MAVRERLENAVAADLAENGITLVLSQGGQTDGDAWVDATTRHGNRVANIHLLDGEWATMQHQPWHQRIPVTSLKVSFPFDDTAAGELITETLNRHGFTTGWNGDPSNAIFITL